MRIFLAGATGVIGSRLVPLLVATGHEVVGMTRSAEKAEALAEAGAVPVVCDVLDATALRAAVAAAAPDLVLHELTDLPDDASAISETAAANNRVRREGTANLLLAAAAAAAPRPARLVAQSVAWALPGEGGAAVVALEEAVLAAGGVVLRYGRFYGPGTYFPEGLPPSPRIHVDAAARRTVELLDAPSGIVPVVETRSPVVETRSPGTA